MEEEEEMAGGGGWLRSWRQPAFPFPLLPLHFFRLFSLFKRAATAGLPSPMSEVLLATTTRQITSFLRKLVNFLGMRGTTLLLSLLKTH